MLKIKDNVDLKELEKFGFGQGIYGSEADKTVTICIDKNRNWNSGTDIIYDLIQAGLVEKG